MIKGLNKPSFQRVRKNYIPPFEDPAWKVAGDARDIVKNGYEVTYASVNNTRYVGLTCTLPLSLAGKTISISAQEIRGTGGAIQISWYVDGVITNKNVQFSTSNKLENIAVPSNITSIFFKIQNNAYSSETYYFRGLQLEVGAFATDFEEKFVDGAEGLLKLAPKKNLTQITEVARKFVTTSNMGNQAGSVLLSNIPVEPNKSYTISFNPSFSMSYKIITQKILTSNTVHNSLYSEMNTGGNGREITITGNTFTFTTTTDEKYVSFTTGNTSSGTFPADIIVQQIQIEEGVTATSFEPYELEWKPIEERFIPKKNMLLPKHSSPKFLDSTIGSSNRVTTALIDDGIVNNKYYEVSITNQTLTDNYYVLHGDLPVGVFKLYKLKPNTTYTLSSYVKTDGSGVLGFIKGILFNQQGTVYSGEKLGNSVTATSWTRSSVTFTTDSNIAGVLIRLQVPVTGLTGKVYFDGLQLEEGALTDFKPYELTNRKTSQVPRKNYLLPFTQWNADSSSAVTVNFLEKTKNRLVVELNNTSPYAGVSMPIDLGIFNNLRGRIVTLSASKFNRSQLNSQIQLRFYGGASGNTDFVIGGGNLVVTKAVPLDFTSVFMRVQSNQAGYTKIEVENLQLELGSISDYESYQLGNREPSIRKAPYLTYPFQFQRQSVEVLDNLQYGMNVPRLKDGGLFIEEGTTNLFGNKTVSANSGTSLMDLGNRVRLTGNTAGNSTGGYMTNITVKASTSYTVSARFIESDSALGKLDFVIEQSGGTTIRKKPIKLGDRYYITFTTDSSITKINVCFYLYGSLVGDYFELYKDWQLEEKAYPTSPTFMSRKPDKVYVTGVEKIIDVVAGSIKIKVDYDDINLAKLSSGFFFDTSSTSRWFSNYDVNLKKVQLNVVGLGLIQLPDTVLQAKNDILIEWSGKSLTFTVNGVSSTATNGTGGAITAGTLSLGQRFTYDNAWLDGSMKEFTVKDRNGKITFQI